MNDIKKDSINLEVGHYINDGETDLLVCEIKEFEGILYVYLFNEIDDEAFFCKMMRNDDGWFFIRETSPAQIKQLIIHFSNIKGIVKGELNGK